MTRGTPRHLTGTALAAALFLASLGLAAPAYAETSCTVNGVTKTGSDITGTEGADTIVCTSVDAGSVVDALGGNDTITVTGPVNGSIRGGDGDDHFTVESTGSVGGAGSLDGQTDVDTFDIYGSVAGAIRGGQGKDEIHLYRGATLLKSGDIRGAKEADKITIDTGVDVEGLVEGNEDNDTITIDTVGPDGRVHGDDGNDTITVTKNQNIVDGGAGTDTCHVGGNPPLNCEIL
ncbi:hypothetical protein [Streptomyces sp. UNOB3_S3]|uniref:hypothetical protein n=1 Tax=Streptomyces sp. UNOB3_S3 TaxID=2871682 RepID=UPI001E38F6D8|nr:hypothetical protein [Streptomyces sp. UNOB3_S3]MCC3776657.1 hypothetical protein [Streptomyces sp. UNOB3_S3]